MDTKVLGGKIVEVLKTIYNPEIPVDIYKLGLARDVLVNEDCDVKVFVTLTLPNCPVADALPMEVKERAQNIDNVRETIVEFTLDPPWHQDMMNEVTKLGLGFL